MARVTQPRRQLLPPPKSPNQPASHKKTQTIFPTAAASPETNQSNQANRIKKQEVDKKDFARDIDETHVNKRRFFSLRK